MRATYTYEGLWMSPRVVIARMNALIEKYGYKKVTSSGKFKHEREAWTSGMFALGLKEFTHREYWVEIETVEPDFDPKVHRIDRRGVIIA